MLELLVELHWHCQDCVQFGSGVWYVSQYQEQQQTYLCRLMAIIPKSMHHVYCNNCANQQAAAKYSAKTAYSKHLAYTLINLALLFCCAAHIDRESRKELQGQCSITQAGWTENLLATSAVIAAFSGVCQGFPVSIVSTALPLNIFCTEIAERCKIDWHAECPLSVLQVPGPNVLTADVLIQT